MAHELLSIAFVEPFEGKDADCIALIRGLNEQCARMQYGEATLYRDAQHPSLLVNLRYWRSAEAQQQAREDAELHHYWRQLSEVCRVRHVHETLQPIP